MRVCQFHHPPRGKTAQVRHLLRQISASLVNVQRSTSPRFSKSSLYMTNLAIFHKISLRSSPLLAFDKLSTFSGSFVREYHTQPSLFRKISRIKFADFRIRKISIQPTTRGVQQKQFAVFQMKMMCLSSRFFCSVNTFRGTVEAQATPHNP